MIAIIDYGMGNLRSVQKGLERVGFEAVVTRDCARFKSARGVVLPGVGAFSACMENLGKLRACRADSRDRAADKNRFLEFVWDFNCYFPRAKSSASKKDSIFFPAKWSAFAPTRISRFRTWVGTASRRKMTRRFSKGSPAAITFTSCTRFYVVPEDNSIIATTTDYGGSFVSSIATDRLFACQFHPEKSQEIGFAHPRQLRPLCRKRTKQHADHPRHRSQRRPLRSSVSGRNGQRDRLLRQSARGAKHWMSEGATFHPHRRFERRGGRSAGAH